MEVHFEKLSEANKHMISEFSCESDTSGVKSTDRRRIKRHDREIEDFLKDEALDEQNNLFNTTHLLVNEQNELVGFVSLCNDSLKLADDSRNKFESIYCSVPAIKIARLGISSKFQNMGYGKQLLNYSLYKAIQVSNISGVAFITLDCYEHRKSYYEKLGFTKTDEQPSPRPYDTPVSMYKHVLTWLNELT